MIKQFLGILVIDCKLVSMVVLFLVGDRWDNHKANVLGVYYLWHSRKHLQILILLRKYLFRDTIRGIRKVGCYYK